MLNKFFLGLILSVLVGCQAGWDKDPTIEGVPPEVEQAPETHMAAMRDAIFILSETRYDFVEGKVGSSVEFDIKVLQPDIAEIKAEIAGLDEFLPGSVQNFDPATGKFTIDWDVPKVFVRGVESGEAVYQLKIKVDTKSLDGSKAQREQVIEFRVLRNLERPEIISVTPKAGGSTLEMKEGESKVLTVVVRDPNVSNQILNIAEPILMVESPTNTSQKSGAHLMKVNQPKRDDADPELWIFEVTVDTYNRELTNNMELFHYSLRAYTPMAMSAAQLRSTAWPGNFRVNTNVGVVEWTGNTGGVSDVRFWEGSSNYYYFSFYEPKGEGRVEMIEVDANCGGGGTNVPLCECSSSGDKQICSIHWIPGSVHTNPRQDVTHDFKFKAQAAHKTTKEATGIKEFTLKVRVSARPPGN